MAMPENQDRQLFANHGPIIRYLCQTRCARILGECPNRCHALQPKGEPASTKPKKETKIEIGIVNGTKVKQHDINSNRDAESRARIYEEQSSHKKASLTVINWYLNMVIRSTYQK
ncbi:hypothetical protein N7528_007263 [Penicillium herquei]|nr:hypothetical protein N7528_007263 [Penicillium herquei]